MVVLNENGGRLSGDGAFSLFVRMMENWTPCCEKQWVRMSLQTVEKHLPSEHPQQYCSNYWSVLWWHAYLCR